MAGSVMVISRNWPSCKTITITIAITILFLVSCCCELTNASRDAGNTSEGRSLFRRLIYDDSYMTRYLDNRMPYLKTFDKETNSKQIGYVGIRDYFNFSKVFWPDESYLESKNIEQLLYEELKAMSVVSGIFFTDDMWFYSSDKELQESGGLHANEQLCLKHLNYLNNQLQREANKNNNSSYLYQTGRKQIELLRWIDTWGRPPSEFQWGNKFWVGSYRACKLANVPYEEEEEEQRQQFQGNGADLKKVSTIKFNYCWSKLLAKDWPKEDVLIPKVSLYNGICLPTSCDTILARKNRKLISKLMEFNYSPMQRERLLSRDIDDIYCLPLKRPNVPIGQRWSKESKLFLYATGTWLALILIASFIFYLCSNKKSRTSSSPIRAYLECLTIQKNWKNFMDNNEPGKSSRVDLRALSLIKLASCFLVALGHCMEFFYWYYYSSTIHIIESRRLHYISMHWFTKTVDAFFISSGILAAYTLLDRFPKYKLAHILGARVYLQIQLERYLKMAPILIYAFAFMKTIFVQLGEGPFWDYATYKFSHQGRCRHLTWFRQLLWPIIFDIQSIGGDAHACECLPSSWYIVTTMKMLLIVPIYFYLLYKLKPLRLHILGGTILFSTLWNYVQMSMQNLVYFKHYFQYGMMHATSITIGYFETSYFSAINRFYSLAMGLFAGIHLSRFQRGKIDRWPSYMRGPITWALIVWQLYDLLFRAKLAEINFRLTGTVPSEEEMKWSILLKQRIDSLTIVIFTLRLTTDWSGPLMRNAKVLLKLSKLSYCVYIIHTLLIHYALTSSEHGRLSSEPMQLLMFSTFIITFSFLIALPVHLFIESPLTLLVNQLKSKRQVKNFDKTKTIQQQHLKTTKELHNDDLEFQHYNYNDVNVNLDVDFNVDNEEETKKFVNVLTKQQFDKNK